MSLSTKISLSIFCILLLHINGYFAIKYTPDWTSLDSRPNPAWFDEAKVGIFINWGVYSVPSYGSVWLWYYWKAKHIRKYVDYMNNNYRPGFAYADFAAKLTAEFYDANQWAELFAASGARYIVYSTKHHEGFTMYPSKYSFNWNSMDVGPKRDLIGEMAVALRNKTSLRFGLYHSLFEWFNPLYDRDRANQFKTNTFVATKTLPELYEIVNKYRPDVIWSDGDEQAPDVYWNSTEFIAWLYNESPVKDSVVTNDRWGKGIMCHHGGFLTCQDRYNPGKLQNRKWENAMTIDRKAWGFRREAVIEDFLSMHELLTILVETVSCGGNILINVAPTSYGTIQPIYQERLRQLGAWLKINGEGVYKSSPWKFQNDTRTPGIWYTSKKSKSGVVVYAFVLKWPNSNELSLGALQIGNSARVDVRMLGYNKNLLWKPDEQGGISISFANIPYNSIPSPWAWCIAITGLKNA